MKLNFQKSTGDRARLACGQRRLVVGVEGSSTRGASNHSRGGCAPRFEPSIFNLQSSRSGVALIITLILLAVVTVMAITFLAVSRRERGAVSTTTDTATARLAADAALANAEAQIMANLLATTNPYNFGLVVSTNYINPVGFLNGNTSANPTNVNYDNAGANGEQNIANLLYSPRAPVFIQTNSAGSNDFRFYLDLNRNGRFDTNGVITEINNAGQFTGILLTNVGDPEWIGGLERPDVPHGPNNPFLYRYAFIAVPIGNALDLNAIYNQAATKQVNPDSNPADSVGDGFLRNQGVGTWEINLAAFLTDLNTNQWDPPTVENSANNPYNYREWMTPNFANNGAGFEDALSLLSYRYGYNYNLLATADQLFTNAPNFFPVDNIDAYSDGPLQTTLANINETIRPDQPNQPWSGADNTNHFFNLQELFDPAKTSGGATGGFTNRLLNAGNGTSTYDRYTFYRLLSQMGVDSAPEQGKLNLNYRNVTNGVIVPDMETNFYPWTALEFFTNAADRMLRAYSEEWLARDPSNYVASYNVTNAFGITNIPVLVSNRLVYSSAINRVLQLAANICDATRTNNIGGSHDWPDVFRPIFERDNLGNVFITGYTSLSSRFGPNTVRGTNDLQLAQPYDIADLPKTKVNYTPITDASGQYVNIYGVPWIIGAKKGFPNFNEFTMENIVWIERKLQIARPSTNAPLSEWQTNQMYVMSISNSVGVDCWNSYSTNYIPSGNLSITVQDTLSTILNNSTNGTIQPITSVVQPTIYSINNTVNPTFWPGTLQPWTNNIPNSNSFDVPLNITVPFFANEVCAGGNLPFVFQSTLGSNWDTGIFPLPQLYLVITNHLQIFMLDGNHVIDYAQLSGPNSNTNLNPLIADYVQNNPTAGFWNTNLFGGTPDGVLNQILYSESPQLNGGLLVPTDDRTWANPPGSTVGQEIASFNAFLSPNHVGSGTDPNTVNRYKSTNLDLIVQVPFTPARFVYGYTSWQANDPLVHYMASDLNYSGNEPSGLQTGWHQWNSSTTNLPANNLGALNDRYQPWVTRHLAIAGTDSSPTNLALQDPLIYSSDDWNFPTNKLPTVGWIGRVHRGTPWQTVYLKSPDILREIQVSGNATNYIGGNTWAQWTGDTQLTYNQYFDAGNGAPAQDRLLFDLFSTAFNDNATLGQLSVNVGANDASNPQAGLAAWSALLSGVMVLSNTTPDLLVQTNQYAFPRYGLSTIATPVQPAGAAGTNSVLGKIVAGINAARENANNFAMITSINGTVTNEIPAYFTNADGLTGSFEHVGDILAAPQLTDQSPFLNRADSAQLAYGINDEMYEWLPQQTLSLLRVADSPRYVIYSYGQALKPAPHGIVTSGGNFFGMITNYQVVSEIATRTVVRFNSQRINNVFQTNIFGSLIWTNIPSVTNNNAVIESYNVLPPD